METAGDPASMFRPGASQPVPRLADMDEDGRRKVVGLHPDRAPTIVAGMIVLSEAMRAFELQEVEVSEHDILYGGALRQSTIFRVARTSSLPAKARGFDDPFCALCCPEFLIMVAVSSPRCRGLDYCLGAFNYSFSVPVHLFLYGWIPSI